MYDRGRLVDKGGKRVGEGKGQRSDTSATDAGSNKTVGKNQLPGHRQQEETVCRECVREKESGFDGRGAGVRCLCCSCLCLTLNPVAECMQQSRSPVWISSNSL